MRLFSYLIILFLLVCSTHTGWAYTTEAAKITHLEVRLDNTQQHDCHHQTAQPEKHDCCCNDCEGECGMCIVDVHSPSLALFAASPSVNNQCLSILPDYQFQTPYPYIETLIIPPILG